MHSQQSPVFEISLTPDKNDGLKVHAYLIDPMGEGDIKCATIHSNRFNSWYFIEWDLNHSDLNVKDKSIQSLKSCRSYIEQNISNWFSFCYVPTLWEFE